MKHAGIGRLRTWMLKHIRSNISQTMAIQTDLIGTVQKRLRPQAIDAVVETGEHALLWARILMADFMKLLVALVYKTPRIVFQNLGNGTFEELGEEVGPGVMESHSGRGSAFGDFDNDGDVDILIINMNEPPSLLRNDLSGKQNRIKILLEGVKSNRSAIGARVLVHYGDKVQAPARVSQSSYYSSNDPRLHFGIGESKVVNVDIYWPNGLHEGHCRQPTGYNSGRKRSCE